MKPSSETIPPIKKQSSYAPLGFTPLQRNPDLPTSSAPLQHFFTPLYDSLTFVYNLAPFFSPVLLSIFSYLVRSLFAFHLPSPSMKRDINQYNHRSPGVKEFVDVLEAFF